MMIDGACFICIMGGAGSDTIDGGLGSDFIDVEMKMP